MSETPTPDEQRRLAEELAEQLAKLKVEDAIISTLMTVSSIGFRRVSAAPEAGGERDLEQTRLAIETMRALTPLLEPHVPQELVRDFNAAVASLQLAYAKAASAGEAPASGFGESPPPAAS